MANLFRITDKIKSFYDVVYKSVLFVCKVLLLVVILITSVAVLGRYVAFIPDPSWSEEIVLTAMSYMAVLSAALAIRRRAHIRMTALDKLLPRKVILSLDILADFMVLILALVMVWVGWNYAVQIGARGSYVSLPNLSRFWMYFPIPLAGVAMIIFEVETILNHFKEFKVETEGIE